MPVGSDGEVRSVGVRMWRKEKIFSTPSPLRYEPHRHYPRAFCTLPSFARIERPRWRPIELNRDRHLRSHENRGL